MKMAVTATTHHSNILYCVTQVSTVRGAGVLVVAKSSALAIATMQIKFASSESMRTPMLGDRALGYSVNASGLKESVCVSAIEPTCKESNFTTDLKEL